MGITLSLSELKDASTIHEMQIKAFKPLLEKYQDYETSPANETIDKIITRINQSITDYYIINELIEHIYDDAKSWELVTIKQEVGNCYLYEKLGYKRVEKTKVINDKMTIVFYEKVVL
ncbi:GNAT family N-acetyltransferase [Paenibacillus sp. GSMTC-2017]|uniref:GNAT family N-acetyltransferase n=1 Tax=Paenibacillus sp. GSMTC-2017 TaxID=2794350 RepID=UPI0018D825E8|nr:GNAT family N-acetyltransferase [Paenibacillus sp. GSMTC-2017]MBH5316465.1 GNAT family N-acetyltransferase [Paenibacillus sp. GSMTC-2017]